MATYQVKKVRREGRDKGKLGVYRGDTLLMAFGSKAAATADKNRRGQNEKK